MLQKFMTIGTILINFSIFQKFSYNFFKNCNNKSENQLFMTQQEVSNLQFYLLLNIASKYVFKILAVTQTDEVQLKLVLTYKHVKLYIHTIQRTLKYKTIFPTHNMYQAKEAILVCCKIQKIWIILCVNANEAITVSGRFIGSLHSVLEPD